MPSAPKREPYVIARDLNRETDYYTLYHQHPEKTGEFARVGDAEVHYRPTRGNTEYHSDPDQETDPAYHRAWTHSAMWSGDPTAATEDVGGQGKLFRHRGGRADATLYLMQTAKSAQHMVPTMLGMMQNQAWKRGIPEGVTPDTDLSEHSAKLVSGLKARGIVPQSASTEVTNTVSHIPEPHPNLGYREERDVGEWAAPVEELKAGHQTVRNMLRAARGPKPHLSEQLSLFNT